jgi:hypothetical protein
MNAPSFMKNIRPLCIESLEARIAPAFASVFELSSLDGLNGFTINGMAGELSGISVSDAGDVNGDSFGDLIVGSGAKELCDLRQSRWVCSWLGTLGTRRKQRLQDQRRR